MSRIPEEISPEAACRSFEEALPELLEIEGEGGSLSAPECREMQRHAAVCAQCGELLGGYRRTVDLLRGLPGKAAPPGFLDWVVQAARKEEASPARHVGLARRSVRLAAAAALVLGVTGVVLWALLGGPETRPTELASALPAPAESGAGGLLGSVPSVPAAEAEMAPGRELSRDRATGAVRSEASASPALPASVSDAPRGQAKATDLEKALSPGGAAPLASKGIAAGGAARELADNAEPGGFRKPAARIRRQEGSSNAAKRPGGETERAVVPARSSEPGSPAAEGEAAPPLAAVLPPSESLVVLLASASTSELLPGLEKDLMERFGVESPSRGAPRKTLQASSAPAKRPMVRARASTSPKLAAGADSAGKADVPVGEIVLRISREDLKALRGYLSTWAQARGGTLRPQALASRAEARQLSGEGVGARKARTDVAPEPAKMSVEGEQAKEASEEVTVRILLQVPAEGSGVRRSP